MIKKITSPQHSATTFLGSILLLVAAVLFMISLPVTLILVVGVAIWLHRDARSVREANEAAAAKHKDTWGF